MSAAELLTPQLRAAIEAAVGPYPGSRLEQAVSAAGVGPLAIKYGHPRYAEAIRRTGQLIISSTLGFTWGTGVYCTPLRYPLSTAIYGRIGSVARFDPTSWRIYDATDSRAQQLYILWVQSQPLYGLLALTVHALLANQLMRNHFRETFGIHCMLFHPDQADTSPTAGFGAVYTNPTDVWMCVGDFDSAGRLRTGNSPSLYGAWPCVVIEEEFESQLEGVVYAPLVRVGNPPMSTAPLPGAIAAAYSSQTWVRVPS